MICSKRYFFSFVFVLLGSFFISLLLNANNTFALDDVSFDLTSSSTVICSNWTSSYDSLCGYHYVILENLSGFGTSVTCNLSLPDNLHSYILSSDFSSFAILSPYFSSGYTYSSVSCRATSLRSSIRMTLTDNYLPSSPSGSLSIIENGTYDVSSYAEAVVDVPAQVIQGDYHDDLTSINQSILICGAVLLVLYFFYCIYRMIIKSTGGK